MAKHHADEFKEKYRPTDKLDDEIDSSLGDLSLDSIYGFDKPQQSEPSRVAPKGMRRGHIISIDAKDDAVFIDFGGKSQGIAKLSQFEKEPKVGEEMEFAVERYDAAEGLLILTQKGAAAQNVTWENLEIGQIV